MKNNKMDLLKIGIVVPALVISLAACGSANSDAGKSAEAPATEAQAQEARDNQNALLQASLARLAKLNGSGD